MLAASFNIESRSSSLQARQESVGPSANRQAPRQDSTYRWPSHSGTSQAPSLLGRRVILLSCLTDACVNRCRIPSTRHLETPLSARVRASAKRDKNDVRKLIITYLLSYPLNERKSKSMALFFQHINSEVEAQVPDIAWAKCALDHLLRCLCSCHPAPVHSVDYPCIGAIPEGPCMSSWLLHVCPT